MYYWHSNKHVGNEIGGRTLVHRRQISSRQDRYYRAKKSPAPGNSESIVMSCNFICFLHVILATVSTTSIEDWSFLESLYAWFTTFTTIGFGDYIHLESFTRKTAHGDMSKIRLICYGILLSLPYVLGLSLVSCILSCLVASVDQIRHIRDNCIKYFSSVNSLTTRFFPWKRSSCNIRPADNLAQSTPGLEIELNSK